MPVTPTGLDELIHTCLAKDPNERWQGMSDVARQLRWLQSALSSARSGADRPAAARAGRAARGDDRGGSPLAAAVAGVAIGAAAMWMRAAPRRRRRSGVHALLLPPENNYLTGGLALSPDGRTLAFVTADANGERQIWIRPLDSRARAAARRHQRRQRSVLVAVGIEIAFFANDQLKRIAVGGGPATGDLRRRHRRRRIVERRAARSCFSRISRAR